MISQFCIYNFSIISINIILGKQLRTYLSVLCEIVPSQQLCMCSRTSYVKVWGKFQKHIMTLELWICALFVQAGSIINDTQLDKFSANSSSLFLQTQQVGGGDLLALGNPSLWTSEKSRMENHWLTLQNG